MKTLKLKVFLASLLSAWFVSTSCLVVLSLQVSAEQQSVSLSGHTFTANLPDGWAKDNTTSNTTDPRWFAFGMTETEDGYGFFHPWVGWSGKTMPNAFILFAPPEPRENAHGQLTEVSNEVVAITVLKIPSEEVGMNYSGLMDSVANDPYGHPLNATAHAPGVTQKPDDITFDGYQTRLIADSSPGYRVSAYIKLDNETVAVIDVIGLSYGRKALDIINSITVK